MHGSRSKTLELTMKRQFLRFLTTERGRLAIFAVFIVLPMLGGMFLCQFLLKNMLLQGAESTSSAWVSMLVARNPDILTLFSGAPASMQTQTIPG